MPVIGLEGVGGEKAGDRWARGGFGPRVGPPGRFRGRNVKLG